MFSNNLILLILHSKTPDSKFDFETLSKLLEDLYSSNMKQRDVLYLLLEAYSELLQHPQFKLGHQSNSARLIQDLVDSPFHWFIPDFNLKECKTNIDVQNQLYNSYYKHILGQFKFVNIGWCKKELGLEEGVIKISDKVMEKARKGLINEELKELKAEIVQVT